MGFSTRDSHILFFLQKYCFLFKNNIVFLPPEINLEF